MIVGLVSVGFALAANAANATFHRAAARSPWVSRTVCPRPLYKQLARAFKSSH